jgi:pimeloyl-[acyl-carrier protein] synthase
MVALSAHDYIREPYAYFARQRAVSPITRVDFFFGPVWLVTGFAEAEAIMKDARFLRDGRRFDASPPPPPELRAALDLKNLMILVRDPPFHTRVRKLLSKSFTPAVLERLRPALRSCARELLQDMGARNEHDLIADFAYRLPMYAIADLIGMPAQDRHRTQAWSEAFVTFIDFHTTQDDQHAAASMLLEAEAYFHDLLHVRRRAPAADLLSQLIAQQQSGAELSDEEIVATCVLLLSAGHETTVNLIANGYCLLLQHPDELAKLRADRSLLANTVEEVLRFEPPALTSSRWAGEDIDTYGVPMRAGDFVIIALGGAHRDPRAMPEPDSFRIDRKPVRHLAFASGPHFCLGAHLARLEGHVALDMLVDSLIDPRLLEQPEWKDSIALRGFTSLRVAAAVKVPPP